MLKNRCKEAYLRQRVGDWEIDTIVSSSLHCGYGLMTMCDRKTRYCKLFLIRNAKSNLQTYRAIKEAIKTVPVLTLTSDQGVEFYFFRELEEEFKIPLYFCKPHSPWQKGSVENLNSLVREIFPKGTNFNTVSQEEVNRVQEILNSRPKKCLNWLTPAEVMLKNGVMV